MKRFLALLLLVPTIALAQNPGMSINVENWNGLFPRFYSTHITSKDTFTPVASTAYISSVAVVCTNAGTSWTLKLQDKDTTPTVLVPSFTLTVPSNGSPNVSLSYPIPVKMTGGFDVITGGTTAGAADVKVTYWTPSVPTLPTPTPTATFTPTPTPTP